MPTLEDPIAEDRTLFSCIYVHTYIYACMHTYIHISQSQTKYKTSFVVTNFHSPGQCRMFHELNPSTGLYILQCWLCRQSIHWYNSGVTVLCQLSTFWLDLSTVSQKRIQCLLLLNWLKKEKKKKITKTTTPHIANEVIYSGILLTFINLLQDHCQNVILTSGLLSNIGRKAFL